MPGTAASRPDGRGTHAGAVLLAATLWGCTGTVARHAPTGSNHAVVGMATFGFGALVLLAVDARSARLVLRAPTARTTLAIGAIGVCAYAAMYYAAMSLVGVAVGNALALGSGPVFAGVLEVVVERRRLPWRWVCAAAVAVVGLGLLATAAHPPAEGSTATAAGVALALGAGFGYALYSFSAARLIDTGHPSRGVMAAVFAVAALVLLPAGALAGPGPLLSLAGITVVAFLACVPMAFAYLLFGYGLRGLPASTATTLALWEPVVATGLAVVVLGERLTVGGWIGVVLIGLGLLLTVRS